jgi:hypothetical protein
MARDARRLNHFLDACVRVRAELLKYQQRVPETDAKRRYALQRIDAAIARVDRIGRPIGWSFDRFMREHQERVKDRRKALVLLAAGSCMILAAIILVAVLLYLAP